MEVLTYSAMFGAGYAAECAADESYPSPQEPRWVFHFCVTSKKCCLVWSCFSARTKHLEAAASRLLDVTANIGSTPLGTLVDPVAAYTSHVQANAKSAVSIAPVCMNPMATALGIESP